MSHDKSDAWHIEHTHNAARYFVHNRQVAWVALAATLLWGWFGLAWMPQRNDPEIQIKIALAICVWPGMSAERIEQLIARRVEEKVSENVRVKTVESRTRSSVTFVYITLDDAVKDVGKEFDDIKLRLDGIRNLPEGAGPIVFVKDFGSTSALMLSVASPRTGGVEVSLRAREVRQAIESARAEAAAAGEGRRRSLVFCFPPSLNIREVHRPFLTFASHGQAEGVLRDCRTFQGAGYIGVDFVSGASDEGLLEYGKQFVRDHLGGSEFHPDAWPAALIGDPAETELRLASVAGDKYTFREMDTFTDLIKRTLQNIPEVSKVERLGLLDERVNLFYSQERLASYGVQPGRLKGILAARNTPLPGGVVEAGGKNLTIDPSGEFRDEKEIGDVIVGASRTGSPLYLRDLVEVERGYDTPPRYLNYHTWRDAAGTWQRTRCATIAVQMRPGKKIDRFGEAVDRGLASLRQHLPEDLIVVRTSDQPLQVKESVGLFMKSLYEGVALVVLIALVGFWEWRSALLMALAVPMTLAMTYGMMQAVGVDLQKVSIGSLIVALGLLVDDPVVAGDAIKREMAAGHSRVVAAWLGPTKLAKAILYATITNIVAYLPMLLLTGDIGAYLYSLPVVLTCSLVASRIVSMTFIPLLSFYLLRPPSGPEPGLQERRRRGLARLYWRVGGWAVAHRWVVLAGALVFLVAGGMLGKKLRTQFFPKDLSYLFYVDIWLPEDAPLTATNEVARQAEVLTREVIADYGRSHPDAHGKPVEMLESLTTFVGGGGPRFWFSLSPQPRQQNFAQIVIRVKDKRHTRALLGPLQGRLSAEVAGARLSVLELETGPPVGIPISVRLSGDDIPVLRDQARRLKAVFLSVPTATQIQDNWGAESFVVNLEVDPDRASLAGVTNFDVATSSAAAMSGFPVASLREGDRQIPVVARLRVEERAQLSDIQNLYVYSAQGAQKVPLRQISSTSYAMQAEKILRKDQFRTISVSCYPVSGVLPSEVLNAIRPGLAAFERELPPGYRMEIVGEGKQQSESFAQLGVVMVVSILAIFGALVLQFRNAVKPLIVFAAIPFGFVGAFLGLWVMGAPFGFMAFLGVASLMGVIVSHIIVLFDFIEEAQERGEPLVEALLDAGILRLRPVLITVGATVFALFPLASHGGPLWEPLCYVQIGGLSLATFITLLLVPALYAICVLDLKVVKWETRGETGV